MVFSTSVDSPSVADKVTASIAALEAQTPVQLLLRCVASLIGRAVLDERLLTCLLMQNAVGALANLAQREQVTSHSFLLSFDSFSTALCLETPFVFARSSVRLSRTLLSKEQ